ncbi:unnamed protein product [Haemonchus placei]|uniref:Transposase n=1 Tax=Haemonchus placei TaxID=6290 RepID=A0A0N4X7Q0_HAEPC|nr:unnamed protein product [Haemonchus placei]
MTTASLRKKNFEMKEELDRERLQVEELRQRMEKWRDQVVNPGDGQDDIAVDLNAIDPEFLKAYAERRIKNRTQNSRIIGYRKLKYQYWYLSEKVRYGTVRKVNSWMEVARQKEETTLLLLPDGFREVDTILKAQGKVEREVYRKLTEIIMWLDTAGANACIVVGPTCAVSPPKRNGVNWHRQ